MDLTDGDESLEIDFGVFLASDDWTEGTRVAALLGEAKTFGRFERKDLRRGARRGRIVVLTANELAVRGSVGLRYTWKDLGGRHAKLAASFQGLDSDLGQLSAATLRVYADLAWPDSQPRSS
jgi:hypothetical protein